MANKKSKKVTILEGLSRGFTQRSIPSGYMDDPESRTAYGEYFGVVGYEKGRSLSGEILRKRGAFPGERTRLSIVDLGTGTGEFILGLASGFRDRIPLELDLLLIDRSQDALRECSDRMKSKKGISVRFETGVLPEFTSWIDHVAGIDLLTMANLLAENEDRLDGFLRLLSRLLDSLALGGLMVLAEPADRRSSRALLSLGDRLIEKCPEFHILSPCPNDRRGSCPALRDPGDWCHEDRPIVFPPHLKKTAGFLGHIKDSLKMTYLILSRGQGRPPTEGRTLRLVSPFHREKGMAWGLFCDGGSLRKIRLLNRHRKDDTRDFWRLRRGDSILSPPSLQITEKGSPADPFLDWPKGVPVTGLLRADGSPWIESGEEE